jgi:endogenous inhibitor of DNA gyrase (YacG/DUF329 family)
MRSTGTTPPKSSSPADGGRHKTTLFCPDCGHASAVTGDWDVRTVGERRTLRCPDCGTVVDERPVSDRPCRPLVREAPVGRCEGD